MDGSSDTLKLVAGIVEPETRRRCSEILRSLQETGRLEAATCPYPCEFAEFDCLKDVSQALSDHLQRPGRAGAVLLSDMLAEEVASFPRSTWGATSWAKEAILDPHQGNPLSTIALADGPRRVRDIDRVVSRDCGTDGLLEAIQLAVSRLRYLARPEKKRLRQPVVVRLIRSEAELLEYFRLRHRAYAVMGYLDENVENAPSRMELDWCDTTGIHIGAFEMGAPERLVGCARVVATQPLDARFERWTRELARGDYVLSRRVMNPMALGLPIFYSVPELRAPVRAAISEEKVFGELSRVIVAEDYRGAGLANLLVRYALMQARKRKLDGMFLECLRVHVPFYERFGFTEIAGMESQVINVGRTMVPMELMNLEAPRGGRRDQVFAARGRLCACGFSECYGGDYELYGTADCPLRGVP